MSDQTNYALDANIYITAHRTYYAFDIAESFWKHLAEAGHAGRIVSIDRVMKELTKDKDDALSEWAKNECSHAFTNTERPDVVFHYRKMVNWVNGNGYTPAAIAEFTDNPDAWLVAYAKAGGQTVVTHESEEWARRNKVKIPHVCKQFGVRCVNTFTMLRELGMKIG